MPTRSSASRTATAASTTTADLKTLLADAEKVLAALGEDASDEVDDVRERLRAALAEGKASARRALDHAREKTACADEAIRANPYVAIGVAAAAGAVIGALIARGSTFER